MNYKQTTLTVAMMAALIAPSSNAQVFIGGKSAVHQKDNIPVKFASEQPTETSGKFINNGSGDIFLYIPSIPSYSVTGSSTLFYTITLKGGAKFANKPTLFCKIGAAFEQVTDVTVAADTTQAVFSIASGKQINATTNSAVCKLTHSPTVAATGFKTALYKIGSKTAQLVSAVMDYKDGLVPTKQSFVGTYITFAQTLGTEIKSGGFAKIDVKEASKKLVVDANNTNALQAPIGTLKYSMSIAPGDSNGTRVATTAASLTLPSGILKTASVTVSGPVNGLASISIHDGGSCAGSILASTVPTGGANSVVLNVTGATNIDKLQNSTICINLNGNSELAAGQFAAVLGGTPNTNWQPVFLNEQPIRELRKNGASFRVLNIPSPENQDQAFIRLYNPNNSATVVRGTMYGQDGVQIGTSRILDDASAGIPANQVRILTAAQLAKWFGVDKWSGRARLVIDAEASKFQVQALMRGPSQVLVNMSSDTGITD